MKKKYKLKKGRIACLIFFIIFIISSILFFVNKTKSYTIAYDIKDYKINESYDKDNEVYYYEIEKNDIKYNFIVEQKYLKERKLISSIKEKVFEDYKCYLIKSDYFETNPLCSKNDTIIDYHLIPSEFKENIKTKNYTKTLNIEEENYQIETLKDDILIWNYKGFNYITDNKIENIKLFDKDIYNISLATLINDYLFIPNYEQDYNFNEAYVINLKKLSVQKWTLDYEISYESYIAGVNENSIFLIDKKNKLEYELVPHREKMRIVGTSTKKGYIYTNGKQIKKSLLTLSNEEQTFTYQNNYKFYLKDNILYLSYLDNKIKTKISNNEVKEIVYINNDCIYYIADDSLYFYDLEYGETKLITYSEWNFNYNNMIFIYN